MSALSQARNEHKLMQAHTRWRQASAKEDVRDQTYIHASELGGCPLAAAFNHYNIGKAVPGSVGNHDARAYRIFDLGHAVHATLQAQFLAADLVPVEKTTNKPLMEVFVRLPDLNVGGSMDVIVEIEGKRYVVEIKTINSNAWKTLKEPKEEHKVQGATYYRGAVESELVDETGTVIFIYYAKDTSEIKEYWYTLTPADMKRVDTQARKIAELVEELKQGVLPKPVYDNPNKPPCRWCNRAGICFDTMHRRDIQKAISNAQPQTTQQPKSTAKEKRSAPSRLKRFKR